MYSKRTLLALAAGLSLGSCACGNGTTGSAAATCQILSQAYPELTLFRNASLYTTLNEGATPSLPLQPNPSLHAQY
jgi:hypothetical protein